MIWFCSEIKTYAETGFTGVCSISSRARGPTTTSLAFGIVTLAGGFGTTLRTLSGLNATNPLTATVLGAFASTRQTQLHSSPICGLGDLGAPCEADDGPILIPGNG